MLPVMPLNQDVVDALIEAGAAVDQADMSGRTPLDLAILEANWETLILLADQSLKALPSEGAEDPKATLIGRLETLLSNPADNFTESQQALLQWIIGKHSAFPAGTNEQDLMRQIELKDLNAFMQPEQYMFNRQDRTYQEAFSLYLKPECFESSDDQASSESSESSEDQKEFVAGGISFIIFSGNDPLLQELWTFKEEMIKKREDEYFSPYAGSRVPQ
jgi:hypothetical protein